MADPLYTVEALIRRNNTNERWIRHVFAAEHGDVQQHMLDLQREGYEVLSVTSEPYYEEDNNGNLHDPTL